VSFLGRSWASANGNGAGPWKTKGRMIGSALKRKMDAYRRTLMLVACVDDDPVESNGVRLADGLADDNNPAPHVTYHGNDTTIRRREWLVDKAAEILLAAGAIPETLHRADAAPSTIHMHGTMRMGHEVGSSVVDPACEAHLVKKLFLADTSPFPNGIGGPNPTLTAQALATRTAGKIVDRYFS
jgi:choline dehydrogenase-like flavoprotein